MEGLELHEGSASTDEESVSLESISNSELGS